MVFEEGRLITVLGEIASPEQGLIGETVYSYPMVAAEGYHMWKQTQDVQVERFFFSPFSLRWGSPYFSNYRWGYHRWNNGWGYGPRTERVRVRVKDSRSERVNATSRSSRSSTAVRASNTGTTRATSSGRTHTKRDLGQDR